MKIKIIDILNKIANGEQLPKKILYRDAIYEFNEADRDYYDSDNYGLIDCFEIPPILNDEVEILEIKLNTKDMNITEKIGAESNKIEPLKYEVFTMFAEDEPIKEEIYIDNKDLLKTINDITNYINKEAK